MKRHQTYFSFTLIALLFLLNQGSAQTTLKQAPSGGIKFKNLRPGPPPTADVKFFEGNFVRVEENCFIYLYLESENGTQMKFVWLSDFMGSDLLKQGGVALNGKKVKVNWIEKQAYSTQKKAYVFLNEMTYLSID